MEPERPIEKWLRDAARQRRDQAGAPFELHPATRRLLQGEVSRRYSAARPEASGGLSWTRLFPRLAWGLGLATVLGAGLWVLWPGSHPADTELAMGAKQTTDEPKRAEPAAAAKPTAQDFLAFGAKLDVPSARERTAGQPLSAAVTGVETTKGVTVAAPASAPVPSAPAEAGQKGAELLKRPAREEPATLADAVATAQLDRRPGMARSGVVTSVPAAPATPAPRQSNDTLSLGLASKSDTKTSWNYLASKSANQWKQVSRAQQKLEANQAAAAQVLNNFAIEQDGGNLKVIDEDGSVYAGSFETAAAPVRRPREAQPPATGRSARGVGGAAVPSLTRLPTAAGAPGQSYFFRVVGTNRSLNQKVVFTGNLVAEAGALQGSVTNALASQTAGGAVLGNFVQQAPAALSLPQSRISGKAQVGDQPEMEIIATPVQAQEQR